MPVKSFPHASILSLFFFMISFIDVVITMAKQVVRGAPLLHVYDDLLLCVGQWCCFMRSEKSVNTCGYNEVACMVALTKTFPKAIIISFLLLAIGSFYCIT